MKKRIHIGMPLVDEMAPERGYIYHCRDGIGALLGVDPAFVADLKGFVDAGAVVLVGIAASHSRAQEMIVDVATSCVSSLSNDGPIDAICWYRPLVRHANAPRRVLA